MSGAMSGVGQKLIRWAAQLSSVEGTLQHGTPGTLALCEQVIDNAVEQDVIESYTAELIDDRTVVFTVKLKEVQP